jgi:alanyl-tRNA synthetase
MAGPGSGSVKLDARVFNGVKADLRVLAGVSAKDLKALGDEAKAKLGSGVVAYLTVTDGKFSLVVGVTEDRTAKISAVDLVKAGVETLGGQGGGGRPDMAQGGGPDGAKAQDALKAIEAKLAAL